MHINFIQWINFIHLADDMDIILIYTVFGCVFLGSIFIFKVLAETNKQKKLYNFELVKISKNIEGLKELYIKNHFSKKDFQKRQEEMFNDIEVLKSEWLGLNLFIKSKNQH
jgi:uncharacterized membrane protein